MTKIFHIVPRSTGIACTLVFIIAIALFIGIKSRGTPIVIPMVVMAGVMILMAFFLLSSRRTIFTISENGLVVSRTLYGRSIAAAELIPDEAKTLDLSLDTAYRAKWRTNGLGLPDYSLGWFKLRNKEKALMFVTDKHKVVYIPTRSGFSILLSTPSPEAFVQALQETIKN